MEELVADIVFISVIVMMIVVGVIKARRDKDGK